MRRRTVALTVVPLLLATAACGQDSGGETTTAADDTIPGLEVSGEFGKAPKVELKDPLTNKESRSEVIIEGDGDTVEEGQAASLHIQVVNGETGKKTVSTYEQGTPVTGVMSAESLFPAVLDAVVGRPAGTRVAVASTPKEAFGETGAQQYGVAGDENVLFIVDIMAVPLSGPEGKEVEVPEGTPTIKEDEQGEVTGFDFSGAPQKPSGELQVIPVIEGEGPAVEAGDSVTFDYLGQVYGTETIFDQSYTDAPRTFQVGAGSLIKAWDEGLVGVKQGSRVIIIAPPEFGYGKTGNPQANIKGTDTLIFVVDVLGVG